MKKTGKKPLPAMIFRWIAIVMAVYHLVTCVVGIPASQLHRALHLMFACVLTFGCFDLKGKKRDGKFHLEDWILVALSIFSLGYMVLENKVLENRISFVTPFSPLQLVVLIVIAVLVLEATRRLTGLTLPVACLVFLAYAFWGDKIPGVLGHAPFTFRRILEQVSVTSEGIFGSSLGISATYVVIFIILAGFLETTGAGQFFIDIASSATGTRRGGPAKIAVLGSCLFGSISGSSVANVVSTGTFTIPLSKSVGYPNHFAAAVEAVASTGGQLMPPVMAAVAFIMADNLSVPYITICGAALIPALLYYWSLFTTVDTKAVKLGIAGLPRDSLPKARAVLKNGWFLALPFVVLIALLMMSYTPMMAGFYAIISLIVVLLIFDRKKLNWANITNALESGAKGVLSVSVTSACAGIIVGVIMITGLGLKFTSIITSVSQGNLFIALLLSAIVAIILGMGLPTVPAYIVMSSLVAPALIKMGVAPMAAHMFVLYFAVLSCITPPVAIASYAAAAIADANAVRVGFESVRLAVVAYIIPFVFVYNPVLLFEGSIIEIVLSFVTAAMGCLCLTWAIEGVVENKIPWWLRLISLIGAALLVWPEHITDAAGAVIFFVIYYFYRYKVKKTRAAAAAAAPGQEE
jgi:TRAP transporter 4TM/12TM fusion protein